MPRGKNPPARGAVVARYALGWTPAQRGEKALYAWQRRMRGAKPLEIAAELGCSEATVRALLREFKAQNPAPDLEERRQIQLDRMDLQRARLEALLSIAQNGRHAIDKDGVEIFTLPNHEEARRLIMELAKLEERESKFLGLDAPEKREVEVTVQSTEERAMKSLFDRIEKEQA